MLAAALLNYADDEGYFNANPKLIQAECFPLRELSVSVQDSLNHLSKIGYIVLGSVDDGRRYGKVVGFLSHQKINRPTPSKIKDLQINWDGSPPIHAQLNECSLPERNREQGTGKGTGKGVGAQTSSRPRRGTRLPDDFIVPDDWLQWAKSERPSVSARVEAEKFVDYWRSATGQKATKRDWEATWRNWIRNSGGHGSPPFNGPPSVMEAIERA